MTARRLPDGGTPIDRAAGDLAQPAPLPTGSDLPDGGRAINRAKPISFQFDGTEYPAFEGDTIASALLANDVVGGFRSPILGRPRGVFSAGPEEPNAFVEVSEPWFEPIVAATMVDAVDGMVVSSRPGVGRLRADAAPARRAAHRNAHVELLVIGSGHDGYYHARDAAARGERVMLVEQRASIEQGAGGDFVAEGVAYLTRATALGVYDQGYVTVLERAGDRDRLWHVRARHVILATGAFERSIAFADNDRPGVMLSLAASESYQLEYGVLVGSRAVLFTARGGSYGPASVLAANGVEIPAIVDVGGTGTDGDRGLARDAELLEGWVVSGTEGGDRLEAVHAEAPSGERRTIECDALLVSGGWDPNLALWRAIGGGVRYDEQVHAFVPTEGPPWLSVV
ncbi:MAG TPA: 2Fe-2S iron-sulfur cluster-binding protein, partial [Actinomycetota bacterium]|nr:2Fe-2S iron-sulfur cluster-binding protein [Actinomycetota bacterium]